MNTPDFNNCIFNGNVSCDSWLVLSLKYFTEWSGACNGTRSVNVIADLKCNNLGKDLSRVYTLDDVNITFSSDFGEINNYALSDDGYASVVLNASSFGAAHVTVSLNNQIISSIVNIPSNVSCGVYNNRSGKYYYKIQDAIEDNDTMSGDVIALKSGFYTENIFIYKNISLVGEDNVYLNPFVDSKATITIFGSNISVSNLCIGGVDESYAVSALGVNISFTNCNFTDAMVGLYLMGCVNISVLNCNFLDNEYGSYSSYTRNLLFNGSRFIEDSYGVYALSDVDLKVDNCIFDDCWIGIDLSYCNTTLIHESNITSSYLGLELINSNKTSISGDLFSGNIVGYSLFNSSVVVSLNVFRDNVLGDFGSFDDPSVVLQKDMWSCGPASLITILNRLGYSNFNQEMIINATNINNNGTSLFGLYKFLKDNGFSNAMALRINSSNIRLLDLVLLNINGNYHFSVVWNFTDDWIVLADSTAGLLNISWTSFDKLFSGIILTVNGSNRVGFVISNQEMAKIYGTYVWDDAWAWMNGPAFTIPGYKNLDKDYGVLGNFIKTIGYLGLGIQDNGEISRLDLALDVLSVVSCVGTVGRVSTTLSRVSTPIKNFIRYDKIEGFINKVNKLDCVLNWIGDPKGSAIKYISTISSVDFSLVNIKYYKKFYMEMANSAIYGVESFSSYTIKIALEHNKYIKQFFNNNYRAVGDLFNQNLWNSLPNLISGTIDNIKSWGGSHLKNTYSNIAGHLKLNKCIGKKVIKTISKVSKKAFKIFKSLKEHKILKKSFNSFKMKIKSSKIYKSVKHTVKTMKKVVKSSKIYKSISKTKVFKYTKHVFRGFSNYIRVSAKNDF